MLAKSVANTFSQAASHYKQHDVVQRLTADILMSQSRLSGHLLDIGCGPGTDFSAFKPLTKVTAVDIAPGMLEQVAQHFPHYQTLCSDAQNMGINANSVDHVYSNLALQWCQDYPQAIAEIHRVLVDKGECHLAIVSAGSLPQLKQLGFRINHFNHQTALLSPFISSQNNDNDTSHWQLISSAEQTVTVYFDDLRSLLYSIKGVGATAGGNDAGVQGVLTKSQWAKRLELAKQLSTHQGIPLSYQVVFIHAKKAT
ncbi:methyltransferase domain-containing protein [Shewanella gaetbuli]|uniref:Methyltransferase domain-containing protein n=1 Tax=Shewanella gaetbuli TaxID=220752 RepID=A0A9X2CKP0_9GAMM|nr:methyltransferase domain-containing protein [Shewanella gaetbuli]MCL1143296.1 methyltransferase domain-containing protein [Shewanella gaetbuli]